LLKNTQKTRNMKKKNSKRKRVKKWNVCTSSSSQVVQVFVAQAKDLVNALASNYFHIFTSLQINLELVR
jgi:hypothetical protein